MTTVNHLSSKTPEELAEMREKGRLAREQKKVDGEHLRKEYLDLEHWRSLASKHGVRLPADYYPASDVKYVKRVLKKCGVDVKDFLESTGLTNLKDFSILNPDFNAQAYVGLALEYVEEVE